MYNVEQKDNYIPPQFFSSDNWLAFCAKFGALFYDMRSDSPSTIEWASFVYDSSSNIDTLLKVLDNIAMDEPDLKRPGMGKVKKRYFDSIRAARPVSTASLCCSSCKGDGNVIIVEYFNNNQWEVIDPSTEVFGAPGERIGVCVAPCTCVGGRQESVGKRWAPRRCADNPRFFDMDAYTHAKTFVGNCISIYGKDKKVAQY